MICEQVGDHLNETQAWRVEVVKEDFLEEVILKSATLHSE